MKKKMNNKGFTLVELIVVLVILAILAAILVPTLMGYIDRAKSEKDFSTAQAIRVATQSVVAELYATDEDGIIKKAEIEAKSRKILDLVGVDASGKLDGKDISITSVTMSETKDNQIKAMEVKIGTASYVYSSVATDDQDANTWAAKKQTTTPNP